jgi:hypothetical protein
MVCFLSDLTLNEFRIIPEEKLKDFLKKKERDKFVILSWINLRSSPNKKGCFIKYFIKTVLRQYQACIRLYPACIFHHNKNPFP